MQFRIGQYAISGIKVNRLDIYGEVYINYYQIFISVLLCNMRYV